MTRNSKCENNPIVDLRIRICLSDMEHIGKYLKTHWAAELPESVRFALEALVAVYEWQKGGEIK